MNFRFSVTIQSDGLHGQLEAETVTLPRVSIDFPKQPLTSPRVCYDFLNKPIERLGYFAHCRRAAELRLLIHGQLTCRLSGWTFSESELSLNYSAHSHKNTDSTTRLRHQPFEKGMMIYMYIQRETERERFLLIRIGIMSVINIRRDVPTSIYKIYFENNIGES